MIPSSVLILQGCCSILSRKPALTLTASDHSFLGVPVHIAFVRLPTLLWLAASAVILLCPVDCTGPVSVNTLKEDKCVRSHSREASREGSLPRFFHPSFHVPLIATV
jgi:hypothetical protein